MEPFVNFVIRPPRFPIPLFSPFPYLYSHFALRMEKLALSFLFFLCDFGAFCRAEYSVGDLLEAEFTIKGRSFQRKDLEVEFKCSSNHSIEIVLSLHKYMLETVASGRRKHMLTNKCIR